MLEICLNAASEDDDIPSKKLKQEPVYEHSTGTSKVPKKGDTSNKKPKGYHSKLQVSIRGARRSIQKGNLTNFNEAFEKEKVLCTEKKKLQKQKQREKEKALGIPPKPIKDLYKLRKDHIVTKRVLKRVGKETDLETIKKVSREVEEEFRKQKRLTQARLRAKKRAAVIAKKNSENDKTQ